MHTADNHPTSEELGAYSAGCLPEARALEIDAHITTCKACCDTIIGLSSEDTFVGILRGANELPGDEAPVEGRAPHAAGEFSPALAQHTRYEIQEKIGSGGMGDVYKARHRVMQRDVAIKVIRPSLLQQPENVKRFQREVTTAAQLTHPNVVAAFDAEQADTEHFMVMEYVDGVNLAEVVAERGRLGVAEACEFIRQAALGLHYAHERGMVHRDIKPQNLMLTKERTVKILDFGLASLNEGTPSEETPSSSALTTFGSVMGTPDYV
ncbi:MAG: protein kinase, partial [Planctomycetota bacterium]